jgi:hypothetical protein
MVTAMIHRLTAASLVVVMSGCLTYSNFEDTKPHVYAEITAAEVAGSALIALAPMDTQDSHPQYGERFVTWLGGCLLIDAFAYLVTSKK